MDSGIVCKYYSVEEAIEDGAAPLPISCDKTVDVRCTIDIVDHLLSCEVIFFFLCNLACLLLFFVANAEENLSRFIF